MLRISWCTGGAYCRITWVCVVNVHRKGIMQSSQPIFCTHLWVLNAKRYVQMCQCLLVFWTPFISSVFSFFFFFSFSLFFFCCWFGFFLFVFFFPRDSSALTWLVQVWDYPVQWGGLLRATMQLLTYTNPTWVNAVFLCLLLQLGQEAQELTVVKATVIFVNQK